MNLAIEAEKAPTGRLQIDTSSTDYTKMSGSLSKHAQFASAKRMLEEMQNYIRLGLMTLDQSGPWMSCICRPAGSTSI